MVNAESKVCDLSRRCTRKLETTNVSQASPATEVAGRRSVPLQCAVSSVTRVVRGGPPSRQSYLYLRGSREQER